MLKKENVLNALCPPSLAFLRAFSQVIVGKLFFWFGIFYFHASLYLARPSSLFDFSLSSGLSSSSSSSSPRLSNKLRRVPPSSCRLLFPQESSKEIESRTDSSRVRPGVTKLFISAASFSSELSERKKISTRERALLSLLRIPHSVLSLANLPRAPYPPSFFPYPTSSTFSGYRQYRRTLVHGASQIGKDPSSDVRRCRLASSLYVLQLIWTVRTACGWGAQGSKRMPRQISLSPSLRVLHAGQKIPPICFSRTWVVYRGNTRGLLSLLSLLPLFLYSQHHSGERRMLKPRMKAGAVQPRSC